MLGVEPKDEFKEFGTLIIQETTHGSLQIHIPAKVKKSLMLKKGQIMSVLANAKTKEITYKLVEEKE